MLYDYLTSRSSFKVRQFKGEFHGTANFGCAYKIFVKITKTSGTRKRRNMARSLYSEMAVERQIKKLKLTVMEWVKWSQHMSSQPIDLDFYCVFLTTVLAWFFGSHIDFVFLYKCKISQAHLSVCLLNDHNINFTVKSK